MEVDRVWSGGMATGKYRSSGASGILRNEKRFSSRLSAFPRLGNGPRRESDWRCTEGIGRERRACPCGRETVSSRGKVSRRRETHLISPTANCKNSISFTKLSQFQFDPTSTCESLQPAPLDAGDSLRR